MNKRHGIAFALQYIRKKFPRYFFLSLLYHLIRECSSAIHNIWVYHFMISILASGQRFERLLWVLAALTVYDVASGAFFSWYDEQFRPFQEETMSSLVKGEILDQVARMDLAAYDDPAFYNETILALNDTHKKLAEILHLCAQTIGSIAAIFLSLAAYARVGLSYFCLLLILISASLLLSNQIAKRKFDRKKKLVPFERKKTYFSQSLVQRASAQDIRLYDAAVVFKKKYDDAIRQMKEAIQADGIGLARLEFVQSYIIETFALNFGAMAYLAYSAIISHTISLTQFVTAFKGIHVISDALNQIFGKYVAKLHEYRPFIEHFQQFAMRKAEPSNTKYRPELPSSPSIELRNITFRYPGSKKAVIDRLTMSIPKGKRIAIVGRNGAGKSTLVKLLSGLYSPQSGIVLVDGKQVSLKTWAKKYINGYGVLLQQYNLYAFSIANNVAMDDTYDPDKIKQAILNCGWIESGIKLPHGIQTVISKEFDAQGLQLSGGQGQLLASARLYYTTKSLFILDEPSSALDPQMEYELNQRVWKLTEGITTIIISHRLSMTKNADCIYYLDHGKIIEYGTHAQLLSQGGSYAALWQAQAEKYQEHQ
ncbi:MAG: ATP-binding cassette domain-containing protein [Clostridia bacterium]|nr:ATP-binding cassette domain-containing protein [Clostridia bacterium]